MHYGINRGIYMYICMYVSMYILYIYMCIALFVCYRNLSVVPVSLTLCLSFMSAILVLGAPAEIYTQVCTSQTHTTNNTTAATNLLLTMLLCYLYNAYFPELKYCGLSQNKSMTLLRAIYIKHDL